MIISAGVPKLYDWDASADGWTGEGDWVRSSSFTKLGGPYSGTSYVTNAGAGYHTQNPGVDGALGIVGFPGNFLYSPFFKLTALSDVYISFYHSINTEPHWDRSTMQYSTDGGSTWATVGALNDPNGVNWYNSAIYEDAEPNPDPPDEFDDDTFTALGGFVAPPIHGWTSNTNLTPVGYVYQQIKFNAIAGAPLVRLRYFAFSDNNTHGDGWAIDNFRISDVAPVLPSAPLSGKVYTDLDGNGSLGGGETGVAGVQVDLKYFGVHIEYDTTDGAGDYSIVMNPPGDYKAYVTSSLGISEPTTVSQNVSYPGDGTPVTGRNFGLYNGSISGVKFNDLNNNGVNDDGAGFAGFTIQVHRDSCNGALYPVSALTGGGGVYSIPIGPGTWYVREVPISGYRQTAPAGNCTSVSTSGPSGGGLANVTGVNFGNFKLNVINVALTIDKNGDGTKQGTDIDPTPHTEVYDFSKNGTHISFDTVGAAYGSTAQHNNQDTGSYQLVKIVGTPAGWQRTAGADTMALVVSVSGATNEILHMDYQQFGISGQKYEDLDGDGVKDGGEPGLPGWVITLTGAGGGADTTDGSGNYSLSGAGPGSHNLSEAVPSGWVATTPAGGTTTFSQNSGVAKVQDFGNFQTVCVSGVKYRDRNSNGTRDVGEEGLSGWTIRLGNLSTTTDGDGNYSFCDLGGGSDTLREDPQVGYVQTEPVAGYVVVTRTSNVDVTQNFGNFDQNDATNYRTWTVAELSGANEKKPGKAYKPGKTPDPLKNYVNSANLIKDLLAQGAVLQVGLPGQTSIGGKEKAYLNPLKQSGAYATFNKKGIVHSGACRGFDLDVKGKLMLKKFKEMPPTKKNDNVVAELFALKINIAASEKLKYIGGNLGDLVINDGGDWNGQTIYQFAAAADGYATNWEGVGFATYDSMCATAARINGAFSTGSTSDTATGWGSLKLTWLAPISVDSRPFLLHTKTTSRPPVIENQPAQLPSVFALNQNYPNPFNPTTSISFDLPEDAVVTLTIYNALGQQVATLIENEEFSAGTEEVEFDASSYASGVYVYRISARTYDEDGNVNATTAFSSVKKLLLVK
ncbi:MAG TPA: SdrD B-like domain-containing protein [Bacteroidota bacterium]|nr:SdrD B-like domain-containing protein [Bacteroidota bacterium]